METTEHIIAGGKLLAYVVRAELKPAKTTFLTPLESNVQVGYIVYPSGHTIARHVHRPVERHIVGTTEVLVVRKGRCEMDVYDDDRQLVATRELREGDLMIMVGGGHGFRMLEDTVLLEVKQGPYMGQDDKLRF